jgi:hypothetical protein
MPPTSELRRGTSPLGARSFETEASRLAFVMNLSEQELKKVLDTRWQIRKPKRVSLRGLPAPGK